MTLPQLYDIYHRHPVVTTDTRHCPEGSLFFALRGDKFDGNAFALDALANGCAYAVVDDAEVAAKDARCLFVDDVLSILQELAAHHRRVLDTPVLQITGTNGKTTTKELVAAVLGEKFKVLYTEGNLNNHIGVPLTLLRLRPEHDFAVIETGANHPGEIAQLSKIVQPNCGLITNVGKAHLEGFGSFEGVVKTKTELYRYLAQRNTEITETLITGETRFKPDAVPFFVFVNGDNEFLMPHVAECGLPSLTYGSPGHGYTIEGEVVDCTPFLTLRWRKADGAWHKVSTHLVGAYNIDNVLAAVLVGLCFKVPLTAIDHALQHYAPHNNRSEYRKTEHNSLIIDAYNANLSSMQAALTSFRQTTAAHKMMILGDMRELGAASADAHAEVLRQATTCGCEEIWLVGECFTAAASALALPPAVKVRTFANVEAVENELLSHPVSDHLILIKGSNGTRLFRLPEFL